MDKEEKLTPFQERLLKALELGKPMTYEERLEWLKQGKKGKKKGKKK